MSVDYDLGERGDAMPSARTLLERAMAGSSRSRPTHTLPPDM